MNALLLAWPFVPPGSVVVVFLSLLLAYPKTPGWTWKLGVLLLLHTFDWFVAGVMVALAVLLTCSPARLTRRHVKTATVSIGLNTLEMALLWLAQRWGAWTDKF